MVAEGGKKERKGKGEENQRKQNRLDDSAYESFLYVSVTYLEEHHRNGFTRDHVTCWRGNGEGEGGYAQENVQSMDAPPLTNL